MLDYFPECLTYMARIENDFQGTFSLQFDASKPYTHKSQYLLKAQLTGSNNSNLRGNDQPNTFVGNAGNNTIDGEARSDTVVLKFEKSQYTIESSDEGLKISGPEGTDILKNIEIL